MSHDDPTPPDDTGLAPEGQETAPEAPESTPRQLILPGLDRFLDGCPEDIAETIRALMED